jgi:hypothetical protein
MHECDDDVDVDDDNACRSIAATCQNFKARRPSPATRGCRKLKLHLKLII